MEDLVQALAKVHREVVIPDIERIVGRLRNETKAGFDEVRGQFEDVLGHFDAIYHRFDKLETEYICSSSA